VDILSPLSSWGMPNGHAYKHAMQPMHLLGMTYTAPSLSLVIAPVGHTSMQGALAQWRHETGISRPSEVL